MTYMENYIPIPNTEGLAQVGAEPMQPVQDIFYQDLFEYSRMRKRLDQLIADWDEPCKIAYLRWKERYVELNIENLRQSGKLLLDETLIPDRIIDTNIGREMPEALAFLTDSHRLAIFKCTSNPDIVTEKLEDEYTEGLRYAGWQSEIQQFLDGRALHGTDHFEIVFDASKPLHVAFEYVGYDRYFYNRRCKPQDSPFVMRKYEITMGKLEEFKNQYGFDAAQVDRILEKNTADKQKDELTTIYKVYFKYQDCVYIGWYGTGSQIDGWLKAPEHLRLGIYEETEEQVEVIDPRTMLPAIQTVKSMVESKIRNYPVFTGVYKIDSQHNIADKKGRAFLDGPIQEATTALTSAFVNGAQRASNIYAAPETNDGDSTEIKQLDTQLENGGIYNVPLQFFNTPYPDVSMLSGLGYLTSHNSAQSGKQDFAVMNRKDSRKTAEELEQASAESQKATGVNLSSLSETFREALSFAWLIVQSQAKRGQIKFLLIPQPTPAGNEFVNDIATISETFDVKPAGDVDYIQRKDLIVKMQQDWPVMQNTPLAQQFLLDFVSVRYPEKSAEYRKILAAGDVARNLVMSLSALVKGFADPAELAALNPQEKMQLVQIQQQVIAFLGQDPTATQKPPQPKV